jgi:hypothetical protein
MLEKKGRELMRKLLQEHLDNRSPGQCDDPPVEGADGVVRSRVRLQERELETVFGTVSAFDPVATLMSTGRSMKPASTKGTIRISTPLASCHLLVLLFRLSIAII